MGGLNIDLREIHSIGRHTREHIVSAALCPELGRWGIFLSGLSEARSGFRFVRVKPDFSQVLACLGGSGRVLLGGEWQVLEPGFAYVTPRGVLHSYYAEGRKPWRLAWVMYGPSATTAPGTRLGAAVSVSLDALPLAQVIEGLYRELQRPRDASVREHWAALVHAHAERAVAAPAGDRRLFELWQEVRERLAEPWDLGSLAARAGVSAEHLRRLCRVEHGVSPLRYLTRLRMHHAAGLLGLPPYTVERVAELVGYENPFAFSTAFKRVMGHSPSRLRNHGP